MIIPEVLASVISPKNALIIGAFAAGALLSAAHLLISKHDEDVANIYLNQEAMQTVIERLVDDLADNRLNDLKRLTSMQEHIKAASEKQSAIISWLDQVEATQKRLSEEHAAMKERTK